MNEFCKVLLLSILSSSVFAANGTISIAGCDKDTSGASIIVKSYDIYVDGSKAITSDKNPIIVDLSRFSGRLIKVSATCTSEWGETSDKSEEKIVNLSKPGKPVLEITVGGTGPIAWELKFK